MSSPCGRSGTGGRQVGANSTGPWRQSFDKRSAWPPELPQDDVQVHRHVNYRNAQVTCSATTASCGTYCTEAQLRWGHPVASYDLRLQRWAVRLWARHRLRLRRSGQQNGWAGTRKRELDAALEKLDIPLEEAPRVR